MRFSPVWFACVFVLSGATLPDTLPDLHQPVEVIRDRWGVPHIYAKNTDDLFFAQGWVTARDRLFQIDLWRRTGTGKLAEVLGPSAIPRDRIARLVRFRGNWDEEWRSYSPDAKQIAVAFTNGINAYIYSLHGQRPLEFKLAGYDPGLWTAEDVAARVAGLLMCGNVRREVQRAMDVTQFGIEKVQKYMPPDPFIALDPPHGLDLATITAAILHDYDSAIGPVALAPNQGSNNWVIDGSMSDSGMPLLANDPHRPVLIPSLRKTVHLVAPGWDVIGAGEPALPGVALGHNENIAFGFTIVGIDQQDLYVETLNPENPDQYRYKGEWKSVEIERESINVKGQAAPETVELRYTQHGPILYEDRANSRAYALKWVGSEPGGAGYLPALALVRANNWSEFRKATANYKIPSENLVYADRAGNIGWIASGLAPVRPNWSGLFPVPGENGEYEWNGYLSIDDKPQAFNPAKHYIVTANNNILPPGYTKQLSYEWATPDRAQRIDEMLAGRHGLDVHDFEDMQLDVVSMNARRFERLLGRHSKLGTWGGQIRVDSHEALLYELWIAELPRAVFGPELGSHVSIQRTLTELEEHPNWDAVSKAYDAATRKIKDDMVWGDLHKIFFQHPLNDPHFNRGPFARPGDNFTVNATSGPGLHQTSGASYRQILDLSDWDRSVMINTPGESGDPTSRHYSDLIQDWAWGQYHLMPFTRKAVEAAAEERLMLMPRRNSPTP